MKTKPRTQAYKHELAVGKEIADRLPQMKTQVETAAAMGISRQAVCRIERRALFKLQQRLRLILLDDSPEMVCNRS